MRKLVYDDGQGPRVLRGEITEETEFFRIITLCGDELLLSKKIVLRVGPAKEKTRGSGNE
jgi:hypothetical protein